MSSTRRKNRAYLRRFLNNSLCESSTVRILQFGKSSSHSSWKFEWPSFSVIKSVDNLRYKAQMCEYYNLVNLVHIAPGNFNDQASLWKNLWITYNIFFSHFDFSKNVYKELQVYNNLIHSRLIETNQIAKRSIPTWVFWILAKNCSEK